MKNIILYSIITLLISIFYLNNSYVPKFNGIDISHHNHVNWKKIKGDSNIEFCYIKATEGKSFRDPMCYKHSKQAHDNGLLVGLYHYFRIDVSAQSQFENFKLMYNSIPSELIPVIDVEETGNNFRNISNLNNKLEELIALFEKEYGCKPIIYLGSWCCWKVIPSIYQCPIWLRFLKVYHFIPNTTIKQTAIIDNLDRNYCKDINKIILK